MPLRIAKEGVRLTVDIGTFRYGEREDQWSSGGWLFEDDQAVDEAKLSEDAITSEEIAVGFYSGGFDRKKKDTPSGWVFVEVPGETGSIYWTKSHLAYWANPEQLDRLPLE